VLHPIRHYYPTDPSPREKLIQIVRQAKKRLNADRIFPNPAAELRACGSHWAFSDVALTGGFIVECNQPERPGEPVLHPPMNRTLREVVPRSMTDEAWRFFDAQRQQKAVALDSTKVPDQTVFYLFHVEAGIQVWGLYCRLDSGDNDPGSLAKRFEEEYQAPDYLGAWAMATLGGAGGQTIVGAFSTGTHGGDVALPPIADAVQAIHLIGALGKQYWIELGGLAGRPIGDRLGAEAFAMLAIALLAVAGA
jgi:hypothetical protein